jgi:hypothetical protein
MADQNRSIEERFRRDHEDEDRRWRRRDEEGYWRRDDRERKFSRNESYGRGSQSDGQGDSYGGQDAGWGQRYGQPHGNQSGFGHFGGYRGGQDCEREGRYNSGAPQYGSFGVTDSGRQGREWQQYGGSGSHQMGARQNGEHRGKGPKGYKRSDERIREDVCDRLSYDDELDASEITVTVKDGEVTLEGTVTDRRAKHRAEDLAESAGGVRDVDNKLRKSKGMLQEMGDRLTGSQNNERGGHAGSGTKNAPSSTSMSR